MDVIAHRGARLLAVENTVEALGIALQEGADGLEFDVQLCADGEPVVFHDGSPERLAAEPGRIGRWKWRDLRALVLRDARGRRGQIPHLDEVLELLEGCGALNNLELKVARGADPELLAETVASRLAGVRGRWVVSSFSRAALRRFAAGSGDRPLAPLVHVVSGRDYSRLADDSEDGKAAEREVRAELGDAREGLHVHGRLLSPGRLGRWAAGGWTVRAWVINGDERWSRCLDLGVPAVITDDPGGLRSYLQRRLG